MFTEYYEQCSSAVYRYLVHLVGNSGAADDLFQETWVKALEHRHQLRDPGMFATWLFRIARNVAFNEMRKSRRKCQVWILSNLAGPEEEERGDPLDRLAHPDPGPFDQTLNRQRREIMQRAIAELDLDSKEMLQLRYFEGLSLAEVAQVLDAPLGTVCTKIHRGLKAVQDRLKTTGIHSRKDI